MKRATKVIICIGTGGVGKTSVAAAVAWSLAQQNKKTLVLTIDPAQRLKTTLKLTSSDTIQHVEGDLYASQLNPKKTFDDFVTRGMKDPQKRSGLLNNRLYQQLSTTLSGSQEFTALEKLFSLYESGDFDTIVVDTPPAQHALDFLSAPQKIAQLFQESITRWFREGSEAQGFPGVFRGFVNAGTHRVLKAMDFLTGSEFMSELSAFFSSIHSWQSALEQRIVDVQKLLAHPSTEFYLVVNLDEAKLMEAKSLSRQIRRDGFQLTRVFVNRAYPLWLPQKRSEKRMTPGQEFLGQIQDYYQVKSEQLNKFSYEIGAQASMIQIPEFIEDVSDLDGVQKMAESMKELTST